MSYGEKQTCPYCGNQECEADWVDVEVGWQQCSPFYCDVCGACQIGGYDKEVELTEQEQKTHWYQPGRSHLTCAPTINGIPVQQGMAKMMYELGLLDKKD